MIKRGQSRIHGHTRSFTAYSMRMTVIYEYLTQHSALIVFTHILIRFNDLAFIVWSQHSPSLATNKMYQLHTKKFSNALNKVYRSESYNEPHETTTRRSMGAVLKKGLKTERKRNLALNNAPDANRRPSLPGGSIEKSVGNQRRRSSLPAQVLPSSTSTLSEPSTSSQSTEASGESETKTTTVSARGRRGSLPTMPRKAIPTGARRCSTSPVPNGKTPSFARKTRVYY